MFGKSLTILDENLDWYFCKLLTDNYYGWVKKASLGYMASSAHRVLSKKTFLFKHKDFRIGCIDYLPLGSQICVKEIDNEWARFVLPTNQTHEFAYVPKSHIVNKSEKISNWVSIAEKLIGTPYVWGGKNTIVLDCSALLQLSYQTYGEGVPRNSINQSMLTKETIINNEVLKRGFVIFWKGHVAIMTDKLNYIYANAFHMEVTKEPIENVKARTRQEDPIIKNMNLN